MQNFRKLFPRKTSIIGMIHVDPLPGSPRYAADSWQHVLDKVKHEANVYKKSNIDSILLENMHDIPYIKSAKGPEVVATMTAVVCEIQKVLEKKIPVGIQVLACGGNEALGIAKATGCQFIRNEGFVFAHVGDEGLIESNAGELLRYRKAIDAENVLVFSDIKKKHSSHAMTSDVSLLETAFAAKFFMADGLVLTGRSTGDTTDLKELQLMHENRSKLDVPIMVGSGVTKENVGDYVGIADALIIGSYFKHAGYWANDLCEDRVKDFLHHFNLELSKCSK